LCAIQINDTRFDAVMNTPTDASSVERPGIPLARGAARLLAAMDLAPLLEFKLKTGRRVDVFGVGAGGELVVVEVKSSRQDFMSDRKWRDYLEYCDQFYFAVPEDFPLELLPDDCGLMRVDAYGGAVIRPAPLDPVKPARRKAVTARYARAAAHRLRRLEDPEASLG
jgi:hypothetical protein